ncbi:hypothetical protein V8B55DRAFT_1456861 [Mucor lusitanicus]|uniref:MARVEL domain-containing protein n=2 Tax=Mucor circinelloides f. lusitanicus TaxID=29924 RepID=A0A168K7X4_MUCCL|nr:hypothetical protein FB192DRAFT_1350568 [Mucor lusitanicus]OAD02093.1 hypothetical protein MUCCIDRAFT_164032 [Mucor lusitanicus CBS 277.49]
MNRIITITHCVRLATLITAVVIVIGSLGFYSNNAIPLNPADNDDAQDSNTWIVQTITDRRLISTLVAAQASIFCPLFILLSPSHTAAADTLIEVVCQFLMPVGLALSWTFSILFDLKSTDLIGQTDMCLSQENCVLFGFIFCLKYLIVGLFAVETCLVSVSYLAKGASDGHIQLPMDTGSEK